MVVKDTRPVISWDFDNTLFNESKGKLIEETYKLYKEQADSGKYIMLITTYRSRKYCKIIRKLLPEAKILATAGYRKSIMLKSKYVCCGYNVLKHYDDDWYTLNSIISMGIPGVYVYDENYALEDLPGEVNWVNKNIIESINVDKQKVIKKK